MQTIPALAVETGTREEFIDAFKVALTNDARLIKNKLEELPPDWVAQIRPSPPVPAEDDEIPF